VPKFEEIGRKLDREVQRLRQVVEKKIAPATRRKVAQSLRRISEKLARLAADLESDVAPKSE
jgi:actin-like ATPase involved in cell morphogenesis